MLLIHSWMRTKPNIVILPYIFQIHVCECILYINSDTYIWKNCLEETKIGISLGISIGSMGISLKQSQQKTALKGHRPNSSATTICRHYTSFVKVLFPKVRNQTGLMGIHSHLWSWRTMPGEHVDGVVAWRVQRTDRNSICFLPSSVYTAPYSLCSE